LLYTRTHLKNVFWRNIFVGVSFQILDNQQVACGLKLSPAAILNQNPILEMGSNLDLDSNILGKGAAMIEKVIIMGAAGRDFHNFNVYFKDNQRYHVIAFTAAQIPDIAGRLYPPELAGKLYPDGIPIHPENELADLIRQHNVDLVAFSYSDVPHVEVMHKASLAMAEGADFILIGAPYTMLKSKKRVVAVCAVRTGCGKSQTTRKVCEIIKGMGEKTVVVRHPMPYGDLRNQVVQRYSEYEDFKKHRCTIEEREEFVCRDRLRQNLSASGKRSRCHHLGRGEQ